MAIKKRRGNSKRGYYIHRYKECLHDGVHGTLATTEHWANDIAAAIKINRKTDTNTDTPPDMGTDTTPDATTTHTFTSSEDEGNSPKRGWRREKRQKTST